MKYPDVIDEWSTLNLVSQGKSIARFGDGEFNLVRGGNCVSQRRSFGLQNELQSILKSTNPNLLVGIPRLDKRSPKNANWEKCCAHYTEYLDPHKLYYSAFITRPDSAPWIATDTFFDGIEWLWDKQEVIMVYGSKRSLSKDFPALASAKRIEVVECDYAHTYHRIDELLASIMKIHIERVLLMCGPTATCLASRLSRRGRHAIDLGHIGMWWRAHRNPKLQPQLRTIE